MPPSARFAPERQASLVDSLAADVRAGLTAVPKRVPPRWLYDAVGSALFETICLLPWYRITRAELGLLERHGPEIAVALPGLGEVVELGPGGGEKLARLLGAMPRRLGGVTAHLVDISADALAAATRRLSQLPGVAVRPHRTTFHDGLAALVRDGHRRLVAFLGSNIGNFDPAPAEALMRDIAGALAPGDACLLGVDLVKPEAELVDAYDDPIGVTSAFNLNLLARLNRELSARFDLRAFRHEARWNAAARRVEMHLVSVRPQRVEIPGAGVVARFDAGESIWTESSYKYDPASLDDLGRRAGLTRAARWIDEDARFALTLFTRG